MKQSYSSLDKWNDTQFLKRLVIIVVGILILVVVAFAGYYYWDRYIHLDEKSPLELSIENLEKQILVNPEDPEPRLAVAQYYLENGMYPQAIEQAQQVSQVFPESDSAYFIMGLAYTHSGQPENAIEHLKMFTSLRQGQEMSHIDILLETGLYFLGQNYVTLNQPEEAFSVLEQALSIDHTDADAMYQLGLAYLQTGQNEQAIEQFQNAVRFVPDFIEAYEAMAEGYTALTMFDYVNYARGMVAFSEGDYKKARQNLEKSASNLPDFVPVHLGLGLTYEQLGELKSAQASILRALELDPNNFMASHVLGRIQNALGGN